MTLTSIIITLIVVSIGFWLLKNDLRMDAKTKEILNFVVVIAVVLWLVFGQGILNAAGGLTRP